MMMMVGETEKAQGRWEVIFDDFLGDLNDPGVQDNLSFYSKSSSFVSIYIFFVFCFLVNLNVTGLKFVM